MRGRFAVCLGCRNRPKANGLLSVRQSPELTPEPEADFEGGFPAMMTKCEKFSSNSIAL